MKTTTILLLAICLQACIPLSIAPKIEDYKVVKGKRFKRQLPKQQLFIFSDPKDAGEFYAFIDHKFKLDPDDLSQQIGFAVNGKAFSLTCYEVERSTQTVNFIPIIVDAKLEDSDLSPMLEDHHTTRVGTWYIALGVGNDETLDCLAEQHPDRQLLVEYLKALKDEYLYTHNYAELLLKD